ncbi:hypothetical protein Q9233_017728 [Columba guinea]|nr:hypothetical protein Q9233_017728 [Columba guinea]
MAEGERAESGGAPGGPDGPGPGPGRPPSAADVERAEALKTRANEFFKAKDYEQAVKFYSAAIELNPGNAIYFGNRSLAHLRTEAYGAAPRPHGATCPLVSPQILVQVKEVLAKLPTLVETTLKETEKVTVCGDTHGQFYDLLNIFELNGLPSESNPYAKYTAQMFALFSEVFEWLPLAQCINGRVLCVTVFSAPNYCDQMGNKGSYIHLRGSDLRPDFHQFTAVPHPNVKPMIYANTLLQLGMM